MYLLGDSGGGWGPAPDPRAYALQQGHPAWNYSFSAPQVPVLRVLLSADLKGVQYFSTLEEAGGCRRSHWRESHGSAAHPQPAGSRAGPQD